MTRSWRRSRSSVSGWSLRIFGFSFFLRFLFLFVIFIIIDLASRSASELGVGFFNVEFMHRTSLVRYPHRFYLYTTTYQPPIAANLIPLSRRQIRRCIKQPLPHHIFPVINIEMRLPIPIRLHILLERLQRRPKHPPRQLVIVGIHRLDRDAVDAHPVEIPPRQYLIPVFLDRKHYKLVACVDNVDGGHGVEGGAGMHDEEGGAATSPPEHAGVVAAGEER